MARTNKYTSINFNHIYDNKPSNPTTAAKRPANHPQPSRSHGGMLVLTRLSPKPVTSPIAVSHPQQVPDQIRSDPVPDSISLRPLGSTGPPSAIAPPVAASPKPDKFVPPHLRPGFAGKEERPFPAVFRAEDGGRPKSGGGGGCERLRSGGESDRPGSGGNRPYSSG